MLALTTRGDKSLSVVGRRLKQSEVSMFVRFLCDWKFLIAGNKFAATSVAAVLGSCVVCM